MNATYCSMTSLKNFGNGLSSIRVSTWNESMDIQVLVVVVTLAPEFEPPLAMDVTLYSPQVS